MTKMKWLGWINLYFLICGLALVAVLFDKSEVISKNKIEEVQVQMHAKELPNLEMVRGEVRSGYDISELLTVSDEKIAAGKALFESNCASCHGKEGKGDGAALTPAPRNFTSLEGWTFGPKISSIYSTLQNGSPGTAMSSYNTLPVEDRIALAHYVRSLAAGYPTIDDKDFAVLKDTYELDQDKKSKSQVSIDVAITNMVAEMKTKEIKSEDKLVEEVAE